MFLLVFLSLFSVFRNWLCFVGFGSDGDLDFQMSLSKVKIKIQSTFELSRVVMLLLGATMSKECDELKSQRQRKCLPAAVANMLCITTRLMSAAKSIAKYKTVSWEIYKFNCFQVSEMRIKSLWKLKCEIITNNKCF